MALLLVNLNIMSLVIILAQIRLSPYLEPGFVYVRMHDREDASPLQDGALGFVHLGHPLPTPAMQCYYTLYDHFWTTTPPLLNSDKSPSTWLLSLSSLLGKVVMSTHERVRLCGLAAATKE